MQISIQTALLRVVRSRSCCTAFSFLFAFSRQYPNFIPRGGLRKDLLFGILMVSVISRVLTLSQSSAELFMEEGFAPVDGKCIAGVKGGAA